MKYKYKYGQKTLIRIFCAVVIVVFVWGTLLIVDAIQKEKRASTKDSEAAYVPGNTEQFRAYDVEGLSDEEIERLLELERNNK